MEWNTEEVRESLQHPSVRDYPSLLCSFSDSSLQAVGVATNWKMAQRAGMLMMAATIVVTAKVRAWANAACGNASAPESTWYSKPYEGMAFQRIMILTAITLRVEGVLCFSIVNSIAASGSSQPLLESVSVPAAAVSEASGPFQPPPPRAEGTTQLVVATSEDTDIVSQSMSPWACHKQLIHCA